MFAYPKLTLFNDNLESRLEKTLSSIEISKTSELYQEVLKFNNSLSNINKMDDWYSLNTEFLWLRRNKPPINIVMQTDDWQKSFRVMVWVRKWLYHPTYLAFSIGILFFLMIPICVSIFKLIDSFRTSVLKIKFRRAKKKDEQEKKEISFQKEQIQKEKEQKEEIIEKKEKERIKEVKRAARLKSLPENLKRIKSIAENNLLEINKTTEIKIGNIDFVRTVKTRSKRNYVQVYSIDNKTGEPIKQRLSRKISLTKLLKEEELHPDLFIRVTKNTIVNLNRIVKINQTTLRFTRHNDEDSITIGSIYFPDFEIQSKNFIQF